MTINILGLQTPLTRLSISKDDARDKASTASTRGVPPLQPFTAGAVFILAALFLLIAPAETECAGNYKVMAKKFSSAAKAHKITRVAIIPFSSTNPGLSQEGRAVAERLTTQLVQLGQVEVTERNSLEKVMREHWLAASGAVTQALTNEPGRLMPADAIITGSVLTSAGKCEINARMIETETGIIIATYNTEFTDILPALPEIPTTSFETPFETPADSSGATPEPFSGSAAAPDSRESADICRDAPEIDMLDRSILDLKARHWAVRIKNSGFLYEGFSSSAEAGIVNPKIKEQFYVLLEAWYYKTEIPGLSLDELTRLLETEKKILSIIKSCNGVGEKT
ncbi:MAG TPA: hypothetical protein DCL44_03880 [Elusimicrobia bacterium]|nr:hypothetical protein [Elusimicrobiota bacterium]